jgi:branched-chain amino acid transport system ATP-binding protein/branched-chain amino acid transport system permease protein
MVLAGRLAARWLPEATVAAALVLLPFWCAAQFGSVDLLTRILIWGLFGIGFDLLFGYAGLLSFGQAAFYGTGGFTTAYLLVSGILSNVWLAMLAGVAAAALYSLLVGLLALRRVGIYFAMITLAFGELSYFLENSPLAHWTGGENGLPGVPYPVIALGPLNVAFSGTWRIYGLVAALFLFGYVLARFVVRSPVGSILTAIRLNAARTAALGHRVAGYKLAVFVLSAIYAGLAGSLLGIFQSYMPPSAFALDTSGQLVIQTVIGGVGTLLGPTIGAAVWLYLRDALQQIAAIGALWKFVLGAVFVVLVTVLRRGIAGLGVALWAALRRRAAVPPVAAPAHAGAIAPSLAAPPRAGGPGQLALEALAVSRSYGALRAVAEVSFAVPQGELYAVIGPNGAGKSTFLRLLSGEESPDRGSILLYGEELTGRSVTAVTQAGIAKSYQINQLFLELSARENLRIAALGRQRGALRFDVFRAADRIPAVERIVAALLDELGLAGNADLPVDVLAYGEKRRVELGLALASLPSVLLLDEPLAGLSPSERQEVTELIRRLRAGRTIVLVEHDMDAVFALATRIMVLHEGGRLTEGTPEEIQRDPRVREAYLGGVAEPLHAHA